MHITLFSIGSRGDVQPFIALGIGLKQKGYQVTLAAPENFKAFVEEYQIPFYPLPGDIADFVNTHEGKQLIAKGNGLALARELYKELAKDKYNVKGHITELCQNSDVLLANLTTLFWAAPVTERFNKPLVLINLNPPAVPTSEFPFLQFDFINFNWFNLFTYRLIRAFIWNLNKRDYASFRNALGLKPLTTSFFHNFIDRGVPVMHCFTKELLSRPHDWPSTHQVTGFLDIPAKSKEEPETDEKFLNWMSAGSKPVYMGFGSIPIPDVQKFKELLLKLFTSGHRVVFCEGWSRVPDLPLHDDLFVIKKVNHDWLLPQCKLAIIHGGIGTIHACLKAAVPMIVASIFADQPLWGKLIEQKGLGIHLPFKGISPVKLMKAIKKMEGSNDPSASNSVSLRVRIENGLENTIFRIEEYLRNKT